ncbi:MarC family protein [Candidatus Pacearchaeota archaeon]|nr:MarC family protein [Candidatus Pacearchaeota archaeon]
MGDTITFFIGALVSLFIIINPFSTASVFHVLSKGNSKKKNKSISRRAVIIAIIVLIFFVFLGDLLLKTFSISIEAFKIASGILVLGVGYNMIYSGHSHFRNPEEKKHAEEKEDISIIPLAIPMLSGPGAIATALVLMENANGNPIFILSIIASIIIVCMIAYFLLVRAHVIDKYLGKTGINVIDKLLGLIVLVMGIQFILSGLGGVVPTWF